jgi:hypothetical protein
MADDWSKLVHSGLVSVQLQPAGSDPNAAPGTDPNAVPEPGADEVDPAADGALAGALDQIGV